MAILDSPFHYSNYIQYDTNLHKVAHAKNEPLCFDSKSRKAEGSESTTSMNLVELQQWFP